VYWQFGIGRIAADGAHTLSAIAAANSSFSPSKPSNSTSVASFARRISGLMAAAPRQ